MSKNIFRAEGLCVLKRLDNGQYMNLTDLDFESANNGNNDFYEVPCDSQYVLMIDSIIGKTIYVPVELEQLIPYAPSIKKLKRTSIADVIIARLMFENTSIRFSCEEFNQGKCKFNIWLRIAKDRNSRHEDTELLTLDGIVEIF